VFKCTAHVYEIATAAVKVEKIPDVENVRRL
jgi:hypothetical protein